MEQRRCIMSIPCPNEVKTRHALNDQTILVVLRNNGNIAKIKIDLFSGLGSIVNTWIGSEHSDTGTITGLKLLWDNRTVLSSGSDNTLKLWSSNQDACFANLTEIPGYPMFFAMFPPAPSFGHELAVSGSSERTLVIWDLIEKKSSMTLSVTPDLFYDRIISGGGGDGSSVPLWVIIMEQELQTLKGHTDPVYGLSVLHDRRSVSGSSDQTLRIWS